jgi:hypothetical protein
MLSIDEYDPESQFFCYLCGRIKDNVEWPPQPIVFRIGMAQYTACAKCWDILDSLRQYGDHEKHPVIRNDTWVMVMGDD